MGIQFPPHRIAQYNSGANGRYSNQEGTPRSNRKVEPHKRFNKRGAFKSGNSSKRTEKRIATGQIKRSLSHQSLRSESLLNSARNQERRASANDAIINRQVWGSPAKNKAAEIRRQEADCFSERVRKRNKRLPTEPVLGCLHPWIPSGVYHGDLFTGEFLRYRSF